MQRPWVYSYQPVSSEGWNTTDTLRYDLGCPPSDGTYTLSLGLRFTNRLPYRDLYLVLERRVEDNRRDTVHFVLADSLNRWQTPGTILHEQEVIVTTTQLSCKQPLQLLVYHLMRQQDLTGLTEVGIKVE